MQSFRNSCQRLHQTGQEEIDSVCFYEECQIRLACVNCLRDDFHQGHNSDLRQFNHLKVYLETGIKDYQNAGILDLINQKKQQFQNSKSEIIKGLDRLEGNFLKIIARATEADKFIRESIKIIETKEFSLFKETQAQVLVDLQYNKITERLKNLLQVPQIIEELQIIHQSIKSKLEQVKINAFLQTHCQNALQIETFQKNRLNYDSEIVKEMKLIIEEFNQEKVEANQIYLGGFQSDQKHGRGILINKDSEEITEGIWENNNLKWGLTLVKENEEKYFIYIGFYQNGRYEGQGVQKWSDGRSYEGDYKNGIREGKGKQKWTNGDSYEGGYKNNNYEGTGTYKWSDGRSYEGDYNNGLREGNGIYKWPDGRIYEGEYKNGDREGMGIFIWPNGDREIGIFNNGLSVGEHKVYKPNSENPYKIKIYGEEGKVQESQAIGNQIQE